MVASLIVAFVIATRLQGAVVRPVLTLAETAKHVSRTRDYSVRAVVQTSDEVGALTDAFNTMLDEIETGERALQAARADLERRVVDRTRDLEQAVLSAERVAESLRLSEEQFRFLSDYVPVGIFRTDAEGVLTYANERLLAVLGMEGQPAARDGWPDVIHPDDREKVDDRLGRGPGERGRDGERAQVRRRGRGPLGAGADPAAARRQRAAADRRHRRRRHREEAGRARARADERRAARDVPPGRHGRGRHRRAAQRRQRAQQRQRGLVGATGQDPELERRPARQGGGAAGGEPRATGRLPDRRTSAASPARAVPDRAGREARWRADRDARRGGHGQREHRPHQADHRDPADVRADRRLDRGGRPRGAHRGRRVGVAVRGRLGPPQDPHRARLPGGPPGQPRQAQGAPGAHQPAQQRQARPARLGARRPSDRPALAHGQRIAPHRGRGQRRRHLARESEPHLPVRLHHQGEGPRVRPARQRAGRQAAARLADRAQRRPRARRGASRSSCPAGSASRPPLAQPRSLVSRAPSGSRPATGRRMWNVVPTPTVESKVRRPPCRSTTMAREMARPWPVPRPTGFVV